MGALPDLDVVVPAHDEADTIEAVLDELIATLSSWSTPRVIVCEDGSRDGTPDVVRSLAQRLPVVLLSSRERLGYAGALLGGFEQVRSEYALVFDGDGQYDPRDALKLFERRARADVVLGRRAPRQDSALRLLMTASFGTVYQGLFHTPVRDPSCSFALLRRATVTPILRDVRQMPYGFWWELVARAHAAGLVLVEQDVRHRARTNGVSRAFPLRSIPKRSFNQLLGLGRLWIDLHP
jgi:glycosyltransferase involved in cell wall biosynthesis